MPKIQFYYFKIICEKLYGKKSEFREKKLRQRHFVIKLKMIYLGKFFASIFWILVLISDRLILEACHTAMVPSLLPLPDTMYFSTKHSERIVSACATKDFSRSNDLMQNILSLPSFEPAQTFLNTTIKINVPKPETKLEVLKSFLFWIYGFFGKFLYFLGKEYFRLFTHKENKWNLEWKI